MPSRSFPISWACSSMYEKLLAGKAVYPHAPKSGERGRTLEGRRQTSCSACSTTPTMFGASPPTTMSLSPTTSPSRSHAQGQTENLWRLRNKNGADTFCTLAAKRDAIAGRWHAVESGPFTCYKTGHFYLLLTPLIDIAINLLAM
jgi:hypothetical protein